MWVVTLLELAFMLYIIIGLFVDQVDFPFLETMQGSGFIIVVVSVMVISFMAVFHINKVKTQTKKDMEKLFADVSLKYIAVSMKLSKHEEYSSFGKKNMVRNATCMPYFIEVCVDTQVSMSDPDVEATIPVTSAFNVVQVSATSTVPAYKSALSSEATSASESKPEKSFDMDAYLRS